MCIRDSNNRSSSEFTFERTLLYNRITPFSNESQEVRLSLIHILLSNVKTPLTREEVGVLIDIFPEGGMYGVEWDLLKLVAVSYTHLDVYKRQY